VPLVSSSVVQGPYRVPLTRYPVGHLCTKIIFFAFTGGAAVCCRQFVLNETSPSGEDKIIVMLLLFVVTRSMDQERTQHPSRGVEDSKRILSFDTD